MSVLFNGIERELYADLEPSTLHLLFTCTFYCIYCNVLAFINISHFIFYILQITMTLQTQ